MNELKNLSVDELNELHTHLQTAVDMLERKAVELSTRMRGGIAIPYSAYNYADVNIERFFKPTRQVFEL